jgi:TMEM175 potassium channel family protein
METSRLEAFSDGVFAIAMTLLVLDLKVPPVAPGGPPLGEALLRQWPAYLAFVTSFATIGIMWINHHLNFTLIRRTDHTLLVLNGLLLLGVTFLPFPTALVAAYMGHPGERTAAAVYAGTFLAIGIFWNFLWRYASGGGRLLGRDADPRLVGAVTRAYRPAVLWYSAAFAAAFVHAATSVAIIAVLAVYFARPDLYSRRFGRHESAPASTKPPAGA